MPGDAGGPGLEVTQGRSVRMQKRPFLNACGLARQGCHACLPCPGRMQGHAAALWLWAGKSPPLRALTLGEFHALLGCPGHAAASWLQAGKVDVQKCWGLESFRPQCAAVWLCAAAPAQLWPKLLCREGAAAVQQPASSGKCVALWLLLGCKNANVKEKMRASLLRVLRVLTSALANMYQTSEGWPVLVTCQFPGACTMGRCKTLHRGLLRLDLKPPLLLAEHRGTHLPSHSHKTNPVPVPAPSTDHELTVTKQTLVPVPAPSTDHELLQK
eukprot:715162-Pelagomonas_calceolata.AAC.2